MKKENTQELPSRANLSFSRSPEGDLLTLVSGDWRMGQQVPSVEAVDGQLTSTSKVLRILFDTKELKSWDSGLLTFLVKVIACCSEKKILLERAGLPQLKERRTLFTKELSEIKRFAEGIIEKWSSIANEDSGLFIKEKLDRLAKRMKEIEAGIQFLNEMIGEIEQGAVNRELVMLALNKFTDVFDHIQPHHQKELLRLVLHRAVLSPDKIKIALYGRPPEIG